MTSVLQKYFSASSYLLSQSNRPAKRARRTLEINIKNQVSASVTSDKQRKAEGYCRLGRHTNQAQLIDSADYLVDSLLLLLKGKLDLEFI